MNVDSIIDEALPESRELEFKHPEVSTKDIVKELVALANSGGGSVIVGVEESGGEIDDLHDIPDPSAIEEGVQQSIRERVDPDLSIDHTVEEYTGSMVEYRGTELLVLDAEPRNALYSYRETKGKIIFPYRLGSTKSLMTGSLVYQFYNQGWRPGRTSSVSDDGTSPPGSMSQRRRGVWDEVGEVVSDVASAFVPEAQSEEGLEEKFQDELPDLDLNPSNTPFYFTPAGGLETVTFHQLPFFLNPIAIEGYNLVVQQDGLEPFLTALKEYFDVALDLGHFTITQRNAAWFGRGAADFIAALDVDKRYEAVPNGFTIDKHHSEGTIFIADSQIGTIVVRSRRGIYNTRSQLDEFSISFLTDGIPIDTRSIESFLDDLNYSLDHGRPVDTERERFHFGGQGIEVEAETLLPSRHNDDFVGWAICQNPFYERPELILDDIASELTDFETLTKYERIPCRIKDHHPADESHNYELLKATITPLTEVQGSVPHANTMVWLNW